MNELNELVPGIEVTFKVISEPSLESNDLYLATFILPAVPAKGEIITILGKPFLIHERRWELEDETGELIC